jgi:hypothetical protein
VTTTTRSLVVQVVAIAVGIFVGVQIFEWVTGSTVHVGF